MAREIFRLFYGTLALVRCTRVCVRVLVSSGVRASVQHQPAQPFNDDTQLLFCSGKFRTIGGPNAYDIGWS